MHMQALIANKCNTITVYLNENTDTMTPFKME